MTNKSIYKIELITSVVDFELKVNDIKVAGANEGAGFTSQIPINEWLINGPNVIEIILDEEVHPFEISSYVKMRLGIATEGRVGFEELYKVEHMELSKNPRKRISHVFTVADLPLTLPLSDLPTFNLGDKDLLWKVFRQSKLLYDAFERKDKTTILNLCRFRMEEYDRVNFNLPSTQLQSFSNELDHVFTKEIMLNYLEKDLSIRVDAGGKLLFLEDKEEDMPAINSATPDYSMLRSFMFYWGLDKNKEPFIYR